MGLEEGKRAAELLKGFNKNMKRAGTDPVMQVAYALETGTIRNKHFDQLMQHCQNMDHAADIKVFSSTRYNPEDTLAHRSLHHMQTYMGLERKRKNNAVDYNKYRPATARLIATPGMLSYSHRLLPIGIKAEHVEERFEERTRADGEEHGKTLHYDDDHFAYTIATGLQLARAMPHKLVDENTHGAPVMLPCQDGMLFGEAVMCPKDSYNPIDNILSVHEDVRGDAMIAHMQGDPDWMPQCTLNLNTFVDKSRFKPDQAALYDKWCDIMHTPDAVAAQQSLMNTYAFGIEDPSVRFEQRQLDENLRDLVFSEEWDQVSSFGRKHVAPQNRRPLTDTQEHEALDV